MAHPRRRLGHLLVPCRSALGAGRLGVDVSKVGRLRIVLLDTWHLRPARSPDLWLRNGTEAWAVDRSRVQFLKGPGDSQGPGARPAGHRGGDHDQDSRYRDRDDPPHPIDAGAAVAPERGVDEPTDQDPTDPTNDGQPDRDVVPVARATNLPNELMMIPARMTPMISTVSSTDDGCFCCEASAKP